MTYKGFKYKKENKDDRRWYIICLLLILTIVMVVTIQCFTEIVSQPIEVEFSGKIIGNIQIENDTINAMEGNWKFKVPTYLLVSLFNG